MHAQTDTAARPPRETIDALWTELVAEVRRVLTAIEVDEAARATTTSREEPDHDQHA